MIVLNARKGLRLPFTVEDRGKLSARNFSRFKRLRAAPGLLNGRPSVLEPAPSRVPAVRHGGRRTAGGRRDCRSRLSYSNIGGAKRKRRVRSRAACLRCCLSR
jgi:hypothetical protein